ncbi:9913_t:CDS:2, partial [Paraglomus occultum]
GSFRLLGVISMIGDENKIFLDDMDGSIELDLSPYSGEMEFVLEDTFVVVDGTYSENDEDEIFLVKDVRSPPHEKREITKDEFGYEGYWTPKHPIRDLDVIKSYEAKLMQTQFVILSNVELDNPKTLRKLSMLFKKYQSEAQKGRVFPFFVFIGNFISWKFSYEDHNTKTYRDYMTSLGVLISRYHDLAQNAYFVFVPGSNDPSLGPESLPKPKIPDIFTDRLRAMVSNASFVSNPCRLKYFTKEIVIFHEGDRMLLQTVPLHKTKEITKESLKMQATAGNEMWKSHLDDCLCFNPKPFATGWGYYQPNINEYKSKEHGED